MILGIGVTLNLIAELRTSAAASWPHGKSSGIDGPVQVGVYQSVLGYLATLRMALY